MDKIESLPVNNLDFNVSPTLSTEGNSPKINSYNTYP